MNIVQIVENLEVGGLERMAVDLGSAQKRAGHKSSIYCLFEAGKLGPVAEAAGVSVISFQKKKGFSLRTILQMAWKLKLNRTDVIQTHGSAIHHYGVLAGRLAGVRVVVNTRHGLGNLHTSRKQEERYRKTIRFTSAVAFVCEHGRRHFLDTLNLPPEKCKVIVNGIDLSRFEAVQASPGSRQPLVHFGTVGRLVSAKGHSILLEAFAMLRELYPSVRLSIVGYGELEQQLTRQISDLKLGDCVALEGLRSDIPQIMASWDVFVLSSISEGLPLVVMEAMAAGLPVVSTRIGGVPEILPEGVAGLLCDVGDAKGLCQSMYQAAISSNLLEMGKKGRELAFSEYGIELMQSKYEELYRGLN